jgi:hypothetical protein
MKKRLSIKDPKHLLYGMFALPAVEEKPIRPKKQYGCHNNKFNALTEEERLLVRDSPLTLKQVAEKLSIDVKEDTIGNWRRRLKRAALEANKCAPEEDDDE